MHWAGQKGAVPGWKGSILYLWKAGERRSITYPDGTTVFYGYDEQFRLSELKEGDSIITYGYDPVGRLCEKQFPNGTKTTYRYDRKDQLTELVHQDKEGILDRYTYLYDLWEIRPESPRKEEGWSVRADSTVMGMMPWAGCQKSKRTERSRHGMVMMPLETVHGKKKAGNKPLISIMP